METRYYYSRNCISSALGCISDALGTQQEAIEALRAGSLQYPDNKHAVIMARWGNLKGEPLLDALWKGRMPQKIREDIERHNCVR